MATYFKIMCNCSVSYTDWWSHWSEQFSQKQSFWVHSALTDMYICSSIHTVQATATSMWCLRVNPSYQTANCPLSPSLHAACRFVHVTTYWGDFWEISCNAEGSSWGHFICEISLSIWQLTVGGQLKSRPFKTTTMSALSINNIDALSSCHCCGCCYRTAVSTDVWKVVSHLMWSIIMHS